MKLKIFPKKLYVTLMFKSGNKASFYCSDIKGTTQSPIFEGVHMSSADGKPIELIMGNVEAVFAKRTRLWKIYFV